MKVTRAITAAGTSTARAERAEDRVGTVLHVTGAAGQRARRRVLAALLERRIASR